MGEPIPQSGLIIVGDVLDGLARLDDDSVDAIVTDPPYELAFMGKKWDATGVAFCQETWTECLRVLKPGGHLIAFGGTRTHHRMWCAIEDAGFEVREMLLWMYGQGFPKSLDVSKAIDKAAGAEREVVGRNPNDRPLSQVKGGKAFDRTLDSGQGHTALNLTAPATDAAKQWEGWGTALKPACEPILLARKALSEPTVAANVLKWGTGALNIDATRIAPEESVASHQKGDAGRPEFLQTKGRWPANVIFECTCDESQPGTPQDAVHQPDCPAGMLDAQTAQLKGATGRTTRVDRRFAPGTVGQEGTAPPENDPVYGDTGGASRFFYCAKASRAERERGLEDFEPITGAEAVNRKPDTSGLKSPRAGAGRSAATVRNPHPTVKPIALMRWLVRLVTPPGGLVVDPFCGSGSTLIAAREEGHTFVGIDLSPEYCRIAQARVEGAEVVVAGLPEDAAPEWEE